MRILIAFLIFSVIVLFHEFGHFLLAKKNHITVLEFSLGMGPRILSFERGGTRYSWKVFPFGGSCMMLGEDEPGDDPEPGSFNYAPAWRRILVVAAGPVFNFILAYVLSCVVIGAAGIDHAVVNEVTAGSPAAEAGLKAGDQILRYQGNGIANARELSTDVMIDGVPTDMVRMTVRRDGRKMKIAYSPATEDRWLFGFTYGENSDGKIEIERVNNNSPFYKAGVETGDIITGINGTKLTGYDSLNQYLEEHPLDGSETAFELQRKGKTYSISVYPEKTVTAELGFNLKGGRQKVSFWGILGNSFGEVGYWIHTVFKSLGGLIRGVFSLNDMSGPVGVVSAIGSAYEEAKSYGVLEVVLTMLNMAILLSANLGVMNLLPFPALDGGRLVFLIIEWIRRKPVNRKIEAYVNFAGFAALMGLMVLIMANDIRKLIP